MSSRISQYQHVFFDLDGTLCDSIKDLKKAWLKTISDMKRSVPEFEKLYQVGPPIQEIARRFFPDLNDDEREDALTCFKHNYDYTSTLEETIAYPWISKFLHHLRQNGSNLYILTNKRKYPTNRIIEKFGWQDLFSGVFTPDIKEGMVYKKSELLGVLIQQLGIAPATAIMVGDTAGDVLTGINNSVATAGVTWGYGTQKELQEANCGILLSPKDFEQWM